MNLPFDSSKLKSYQIALNPGYWKWCVKRRQVQHLSGWHDDSSNLPSSFHASADHAKVTFHRGFRTAPFFSTRTTSYLRIANNPAELSLRILIHKSLLIMKFFRNQDARASQDVVIDTAVADRDQSPDAEKNEKIRPVSDDYDNALEEKPSDDVQAGVKKVEAVTLTWTKGELIFAYAWSVMEFDG